MISVEERFGYSVLLVLSVDFVLVRLEFSSLDYCRLPDTQLFVPAVRILAFQSMFLRAEGVCNSG